MLAKGSRTAAFSETFRERQGADTESAEIDAIANLEAGQFVERAAEQAGAVLAWRQPGLQLLQELGVTADLNVAEFHVELWAAALGAEIDADEAQDHRLEGAEQRHLEGPDRALDVYFGDFGPQEVDGRHGGKRELRIRAGREETADRLQLHVEVVGKRALRRHQLADQLFDLAPEAIQVDRVERGRAQQPAVDQAETLNQRDERGPRVRGRRAGGRLRLELRQFGPRQREALRQRGRRVLQQLRSRLQRRDVGLEAVRHDGLARRRWIGDEEEFLDAHLTLQR